MNKIISNLENIQKFASSMQSILVSIAVIIGGAWTLYIFNSQLQVENAQAQLEKLKRELAAESKLEMQIDINRLGKDNSGRHIVVGTVNTKNIGNTNTALIFKSESLQLYKVSFSSDGVEEWERIASIPLRMAENMTTAALMVPVLSANSKPFSFALKETGTYVVRFSAARSIKEAHDVFENGPNGAEYSRNIEWGGLAYFHIETQ